MKKIRKILVAEDNKMIALALKLLFEARGYEVVVANDGQEALDKFERVKQELDFVIVDYHMPHFSGAEVASRIRAAIPKIPIVLASSDATRLRRKVNIRGLFDAVFDKPFMMKEVLSYLEGFEGSSMHVTECEVA